MRGIEIESEQKLEDNELAMGEQNVGEVKLYLEKKGYS